LVSGCSEYNGSNDRKCSKCIDKYYLWESVESSYCFPIQNSLNCEQLSDKIKDGLFECLKCTNGFY